MRPRPFHSVLVTCLGTFILFALLSGCEQSPPAKKPAEPPPPKATETPAPAAQMPIEKPGAPPEPVAEKPTVPEPPKAEPKTEKLVVNVPLGLPPLPIPADNPMTAEKVELGKMLYFDNRVSVDNTVSCATCHDPAKGWAEHEATSEGIHKQRGGRNSPTVINAAYANSQFWDGRAATLEDQAVGPVGNPIEMGHSMTGVVQRFEKIPGYAERFQKVFGTGVTEKGFAQAVAAFERTVLSGDSPYDRYTAGDKAALSDAQKRGLALFEKNCAQCHKPPLFSNYRFMNAGVGMDKPKPDVGRKAVSGKDSDLGKFRVPSLREVANTAPYFHDGSAAKLDDAVALMAGGGKDNPNLSEQLRSVGQAKLTADNRKDLVEFLTALSGKFPVIQPPKLP